MGTTAHIHIEGWRFVPHSYAIVNTFQILELLRRPNLKITFADLPLFNPHWPQIAGLLSLEVDAKLHALSPLSPDDKPDAVYRIAFPYPIRPSPAPRTVVFGTSEIGAIPKDFIEGNRPISEAMKQSPGVHLVTPSRWSRQGFIRSGVHPDRISIIRHGVDPTLFHPPTPEQRQAIRAKLGLEGFVFLHTGAMSGNKRPELLLAATAFLAQSHPQVRLLLKGTDSLYNSQKHFQASIAKLPPQLQQLLSGRVIYMGHSDTFAGIASLYHAADAYVTPYGAEGFNLPALEAVASGLPVICTSGGPTDDFTHPDVMLPVASTTVPFPGHPNAIWLNPDLKSLVAQMTRAIEDQAFRTKAREAGPAFIAEGWTWSHAIDKLLTELLGP